MHQLVRNMLLCVLDVYIVCVSKQVLIHYLATLLAIPT